MSGTEQTGIGSVSTCTDRVSEKIRPPTNRQRATACGPFFWAHSFFVGDARRQGNPASVGRVSAHVSDLRVMTPPARYERALSGSAFGSRSFLEAA